MKCMKCISVLVSVVHIGHLLVCLVSLLFIICVRGSLYWYNLILKCLYSDSLWYVILCASQSALWNVFWCYPASSITSWYKALNPYSYLIVLAIFEITYLPFIITYIPLEGINGPINIGWYSLMWILASLYACTFNCSGVENV